MLRQHFEDFKVDERFSFSSFVIIFRLFFFFFFFFFSHGISHAKTVMNHMSRVLACEGNLSAEKRTILMLAALLHDADDHKYFGKEVTRSKKGPYCFDLHI